MKQSLHIFIKYLRYQLIMVVLRCLPSEEAVGLANLKKKSEGKVGPVPMGQRFQSDFLMEWSRISLKYSSCAQDVMVFASIWGEEAVGLANFKKKSEGDVGPGPMGIDLDLLEISCQIINIYCPSVPS